VKCWALKVVIAVRKGVEWWDKGIVPGQNGGITPVDNRDKEKVESQILPVNNSTRAVTFWGLARPMVPEFGANHH
jgi:hypothetical protein